MRNRGILVIVVATWLAAGWGTRSTEAQCTDNSACGNAQYCQKTLGDCDGTGVCADQPAVCPEVWDPVCGCDGVTYGNSCEAAFAGINIASEGQCPPPACQSNAECGSGEYCAKAAGDCSGDGACTEQPVACPDIWDPVCGCDGITYASVCTANQAGVSVAYDGECLTACQSNADCPPTEYCDTAHNGCWQIGACRLVPDSCTQQYDPVCGCNEVTFDNACLAAIQKVTVVKPGVCGACPYDDSIECIFSDACESGGTGRWSTVVGN